ncbi:T9SS type A sorting domain-containing protein [Hymenobacter rubidus]|uniref:T9SS type A sorting domain-containing protein n=1 Tax=Hymenobacter rubidus TaxID=1441626 RepID=UPI00191CBB36|nr:T9SS type A sorting domain-containing protein [Hymenobacter rubidus]
MPNLTPITRFVAGLLLLGLPVTRLRAQQLDPTFHPPVFVNPAVQNSVTISKVLRQPDGRYLISGGFQSVDGHPSGGIARLLPDGHVDTTFTCTSSGFLLAVQPDGKLLVNNYSAVPPSGHRLSRLLPSGQPDAAFHPALQRSGLFDQVLVQTDGKILLAGMVTDSLGRSGLVRLLPSGRVDASFMASFPVGNAYTSLVLEPNGRMLFASCAFDAPSTGTLVTRLLPSGQVDASFAYTSPQAIQIGKIALCPGGTYAIGGLMGASGQAVGRLLPSGALDAAFPFSLPCTRMSFGFNVVNPVGALAVQPDGRILACGDLLAIRHDVTLLRTQPQGGTDVTWNPDYFYWPDSLFGTVPVYNAARVNDLLVEPNGKLLVAGRFSQAGGVAHNGLARLLAATPLATRQSEKGPSVEAWPVPAHNQLQIALAGDVSTQQITLLNITGRIVLTQQPTASTTTINTAALAPGLYVLQVCQADGTATTRKIVLE